ncbi:unnamed protein product, partial [Anisakis simplex]|uniref:Fmp27_GFWDK domain-containing protein n=1 Tax=Anisakis simplex TaxID=6269 RepID=A0A0M3J8F5_ANISI
GTLQKASSICGNSLDIFNVWIASGSWFIEKIHNRTQIFNESEYLKLKEIDDMAIDFSDGINLSTCDGLNLHVLIPQVRGGPMLWDIIHRIDFKLRCMQPENVNSKECSWINGLKYYVYSAVMGHFADFSL